MPEEDEEIEDPDPTDEELDERDRMDDDEELEEDEDPEWDETEDDEDESKDESSEDKEEEVPDIQPKSIIETSIHNECEDKKPPRIVYLSNQAIKRHIFPNCRGDKDAERFSTRRNKSSQTFKNTVLKVERWDFHLENDGAYLRSNSKVPFWQCTRKDYIGNFQV